MLTSESGWHNEVLGQLKKLNDGYFFNDMFKKIL